MQCVCKGLCEQKDFKKKFTVTKKHLNAFTLGFFRCRKCEYYIKEFTYCPCCGTRLAVVPRNTKSKRLLKSGVGRY